MSINNEKNMIRLSGGKNIRKAREKIDPLMMYSFEEAIELVKKAAYVKFDETLEVSMNLGVDPRHSDQMVRGIVSLPAGTGRVVRVAVICKDEKVEEAKEA